MITGKTERKNEVNPRRNKAPRKGDVGKEIRERRERLGMSDGIQSFDGEGHSSIRKKPEGKVVRKERKRKKKHIGGGGTARTSRKGWGRPQTAKG